MPTRFSTKLERADPAARYDRYRISTNCEGSWSETHKLLTIAALTAMLAESRTQETVSSDSDSTTSGSSGSSSSSGSSGGSQDWNVCRIRFSPKGKSKSGSEVFRKTDSKPQWIGSPRERR